ncbi:MAG TPA: nucleoside monophosphate kinase [Bryobacteraceae bacterium]|nr:nucleoside monophosphate kinase [Bryobacteraceae bacterium]
MKAIVLFGSPGSGKGTQAKVLTRCLKVPHISTGDMLREHIRQGDRLGSAVAARMQSGALVSDEVVEALVEERLAMPDAAGGFVLDGYPRTLAQADHLGRLLDGRGIREMVIYLAVDYNVVIARLTGRRQCPRCGTLYNIVSKPPRDDMRCDLDGEKLVIRDDDREPVIRERLEAYERQTRPVLEHLRLAGRRVVEVDASNDPPDAVSRKICQALECDDRSENCR